MGTRVMHLGLVFLLFLVFFDLVCFITYSSFEICDPSWLTGPESNHYEHISRRIKRRPEETFIEGQAPGSLLTGSTKREESLSL